MTKPEITPIEFLRRFPFTDSDEPEKRLQDIADHCGVTIDAVKKWKERQKVPANQAILFCEATGKKLEQVRGDLYPMTRNPIIEDYVRRYVSRYHDYIFLDSLKGQD